jgi:hypothetical protein
MPAAPYSSILVNSELPFFVSWPLRYAKIEVFISPSGREQMCTDALLSKLRWADCRQIQISEIVAMLFIAGSSHK